MRFQAPRGTQDVLPDMQPYWTAVHAAIEEVTRLFGYHRIDTPVFEPAALFEKGSGDTTDIVEKEMYTFEDRGGDKLALTPEGTPAICRAYLEHGMASWQQPVRLYTTHAMFRYDRPQKGRYRQHTQFDCEVFGSADPLVDAEVMSVLWALYQRLGIRRLVARIGSIDDPEPRKAYVQRLKQYYEPFRERLSEDSRRRLDRNPLRLLDSKDERDQPFKDGAPKLLDQLSQGAAEHHEAVIAALEAAGIPYEVDPLLVRGLDYYNRTVFEFVPMDDDRQQGTVGGGGRYDGLLELSRPDVFVVHKAAGSGPIAFGLANALRNAGVGVVVGESARSFKAQFRHADGSGARFAVILGQSEVDAGTVVLKDLRSESEQRTVPRDDVARLVTEGLRESR